MVTSNRIKLGSWLRTHKTTLSIARSLNKLSYTTTGSMHVLPDFIIIGASRSGTTSLYEYLNQHPSIIRGVGKEIHYFDKNFGRGIKWYKSFFPTKRKKSKLEEKHKGKCLTGESTPRYLYHHHAPKRVFQLLPNVKLIVVLRNPIDRAYSRYEQQAAVGLEELSFEDAIEQEENRITDDMKKMEKDENFYSVYFYRKAYKTMGIYVNQLRRWFEYFPREQFLILKSEDLRSNPAQVYNQTIEFLGLPKHELDSFKAYRMRKYPTLSEKTREKLSDFFRQYNEQLYQLLGRNFDWK
jgi:hypothetical protein